MKITESMIVKAFADNPAQASALAQRSGDGALIGLCMRLKREKREAGLKPAHQAFDGAAARHRATAICSKGTKTRVSDMRKAEMRALIKQGLREAAERASA